MLPDFIKEWADKDYASVPQTALTSVSGVSKTDVETLRTSFGVRPQKPNIFYRIMIANLSRNEIYPEFCRHCKSNSKSITKSTRIWAGKGQEDERRIRETLP
jgi:hypothetical protein